MDRIVEYALATFILSVFLLIVGYTLGKKKPQGQKKGVSMTRAERRAFVKRIMSDAISEAIDSITALPGEDVAKKLTVQEAHQQRLTIGLRCNLPDVCPKTTFMEAVKKQLNTRIKHPHEEGNHGEVEMVSNHEFTRHII